MTDEKPIWLQRVEAMDKHEKIIIDDTMKWQDLRHELNRLSGKFRCETISTGFLITRTW